MIGSKEDRSRIRRILREGRLYQLQDWVNAGKPLRFQRPNSKRTVSVLELAVDVGFHTVVQWLLDNVEWSDEALNHALQGAVWEKQKHMIELLLDYQSPVEGIEFINICEIMDVDLIKRVVDLGVDPTAHDDFSQAFSMTSGRPLLRFFFENRERLPHLEEQLGIAFNVAVREKKLRASILLRWAGIDPAKEYPPDHRGDFPGYNDPAHLEYEDDYRTSPLEELAWHASREFMEKLKVKVPKERLPWLLERAAVFPNESMFKYFLERMPEEQLNDSETKSSPALEKLVSKHFVDWGFYRSQKEPQTIELIEVCLQKGAVWNPPIEDINDTRRCLRTAPADHAVRIIRLLDKYNQAPEKLWKTINTPAMDRVIRDRDIHLWERVRKKAGAEPKRKRRRTKAHA